MRNVKSSQYTSDRCYVYNKAFARWFDNNNPFEETCNTQCDDCGDELFNCIRNWANERGLYDKGDPKTQYIKLNRIVTGKLGVDYIEVERYDGVIEYWINLNR